MQASNKIKAFIAHEEALCLKFMDDDGTPAGGFSHHDKFAPLGTPVTIEEALLLMDKDCRLIDVVLGRRLTTAVTQNQYDALVSLSYNIGPTAIANSALMERINAGDLSTVTEMFLGYEHPARRQREAAIFFRGDYGDLTGNIVPVYRLDTYDNPHGRAPDEWIPWPGAPIGD